MSTKKSISHISRSGKPEGEGIETEEAEQRRKKKGGRAEERERGEEICAEKPGGSEPMAEGLGGLETGTGTLISLRESKTNQFLLWRKQEKIRGRERRGSRQRREGGERWR